MASAWRHGGAESGENNGGSASAAKNKLACALARNSSENVSIRICGEKAASGGSGKLIGGNQRISGVKMAYRKLSGISIEKMKSGSIWLKKPGQHQHRVKPAKKIS